jgi:hypothetical protein
VSTPVAAVVLASRGGLRLERTLASVAWAAECVVLTSPRAPALDAPGDDVRRAAATADLSRLTRLAWLLFLVEGEVVEPTLAAAVDTAVRARSEAVYRVPVELRALGVRLHPRGAPVRLVPAPLARLILRPRPVLALDAAGRPARRLDARLTLVGAASLADAVSDLDADAAVLGSLLHASGRRAGVWRAIAAALGAGVPLLCARAVRRAGWGRWRVGVTAAYGTIVSYAKAWELARADGVR